GARVVDQKLHLPREYAHAADAKTLAQFDRDTDGSLVFALPRDAEPLGAAVLIPPEGVRSFATSFSSPPPAPKPAANPAPPSDAAPIRRGTASFPAPPSSESALPPGGGGIGPKTKGLDRFRVKKSVEDEKPADPPKTEEKKPDEPKADEKRPDEKP